MLGVLPFLVGGMLLGMTAQPGWAHSYGPAPRYTGAPGDNGKACTQCHTTNPLNSGAGSVKVTAQSGSFYIPGLKQRLTVQVADPNQVRWGFELTARLDSDPEKGQAGDLNPIDNKTQVICDDAAPKPCATGLQFIEHTSAGTQNGTRGGATFQFDWTPPPNNAGPVTLYVAGNAANGNGSSAGDLIYTGTLQLKPAVAAAPAIAPGGVVSAMTSAPGPISPNSWVTIYGTNLSPTTRVWNADDFLNGGLPFAVDGVAVILTGAPRLACVGYVSPTQINFMLPSDLTPGTVQVQVRNAAGISAPVPLQVTTTAGQLLTSDGKYVLATHSDGSPVRSTGTSGRAAPGENIVVYATGLGPTTPTQIPAQIPTQFASLLTPPAVSIGGLPASVSSAGILPNTVGVYQIAVQVPANAPNGDLPLIVQLSGVDSVSRLLSVQK